MKAQVGDTVRILHRDMWTVGKVLAIGTDRMFPTIRVRDTFTHPTERNYAKGDIYYTSDIKEVIPCAR